MTPADASNFFQFVIRHLPNLLAKFDDPMEALEDLGKKWREHRDKNIEDRKGAVTANRASIDERLAERRAANEKRVAEAKKKAAEERAKAAKDNEEAAKKAEELREKVAAPIRKANEAAKKKSSKKTTKKAAAKD